MKNKPAEANLDSWPFTIRKLSRREGGGYLVECPAKHS
jgi:hypothetical protein